MCQCVCVLLLLVGLLVIGSLFISFFFYLILLLNILRIALLLRRRCCFRCRCRCFLLLIFYLVFSPPFYFMPIFHFNNNSTNGCKTKQQQKIATFNYDSLNKMQKFLAHCTFTFVVCLLCVCM